MHISQAWVDIAYLIAASLFVLGIKGLTKPKTAVRGNQMAAAGMLIACVVTLLHKNVLSYEVIIAGVLVGGIVGAVMAIKVQAPHDMGDCSLMVVYNCQKYILCFRSRNNAANPITSRNGTTTGARRTAPRN